MDQIAWSMMTQISNQQSAIRNLSFFFSSSLWRRFCASTCSTGNPSGTTRATARGLRSVRCSSSPKGAAGDIHPPLYYYLLHFWRGVFGSSEFALRSLSAVLGVLLVGLTFLIGRKAFSAGVGLLAAFVAAINPFQIYYSQEARMYMLLAVIGAAATFFLLRLLEGLVDQGSGIRWIRDQVDGVCH